MACVVLSGCASPGGGAVEPCALPGGVAGSVLARRRLAFRVVETDPGDQVDNWNIKKRTAISTACNLTGVFKVPDGLLFG